MSMVEMQPKAKPPRIGAKVRRAIEKMADGSAKTITDAAAASNCSREHLSRSLHLPAVAALLEQRTRELLAAGKLRAGARLVELVDSAKSEHVQADCARHVLGIAGIAPPQNGTHVNIINNNISPGYVIDLGLPPAASPPVLEHEPSKPAPEPTAASPWNLSPVGPQSAD